MSEQWIELDGTANTRDLGGVEGVNGGVVLRSDNLQDLTPADVSRLTEDLGVTLVLDLRTPGEAEIEGPTPLDAAGVRKRVLSFVPDADTALADDGRILPDRTGMDPAETYLGYLADMPESVVEAARLVADNDGATLVHCAAGKDRTGVLAALLAEVAGAGRDEVVADYVRTGDVIAPLMSRLAGRPIYAADVHGSDLARHVPKERTMRVFLDALDRDWGGAAGWLTAHGLQQSELTALRERLTRPRTAS